MAIERLFDTYLMSFTCDGLVNIDVDSSEYVNSSEYVTSSEYVNSSE